MRQFNNDGAVDLLASRVPGRPYGTRKVHFRPLYQNDGTGNLTKVPGPSGTVRIPAGSEFFDDTVWPCFDNTVCRQSMGISDASGVFWGDVRCVAQTFALRTRCR